MMEKYLFLVSGIVCFLPMSYTVDSRIIPSPFIIGVPTPQGCYYGDEVFFHQDIILSLPKVCLRLVCNLGVIETQFTGEPGQTDCCEFDGQIYPAGSELPQQCFKISCRRGEWFTDGTIKDCCKHCFVFNDPHIKTFDKYRYDWHGTCNYSVAQTGFGHYPELGVFSDFTPCNGKASCLSRTTFKDNPNTAIVLDNGMISNYVVNGELQSVTSLGVQQVTSSGGAHPVLVWKVQRCLAFSGSSNLAILHCPNRLDIWAHPSHTGNLNGLCGHYNAYQDDDFTTRNNAVEPLTKFPMAFPASWMTVKQSHLGCQDPCPDCFKSKTDDPCEASVALRQRYLEKCRNALQAAIGTSDALVPHIDACAFDVCMMYQNGEDEDDVVDWLRQLVEMVDISQLIVDKQLGDPCFKTCTKILRPVCGTDGRTYSNQCLLDIAICRNKCLKFKHEGQCNPECPIQICTIEYQPICGTDGKTYSNKCHLLAAQCDNPCLEKKHDGMCVDCNRPCPEIFDPVCGSGKTYSNKCELDNAMCENNCIMFAHRGRCVRECPIDYCTKDLRPVCGSDGRTYDNECWLSIGTCDDPCILKAHDGPCLKPRLSVEGVDHQQKAVNAVNAENAVNARNAENAENAVNARNAANAENAAHAENAVYAENAVNARNAENAENAVNARNAENADHAENAENAVNAINAVYALHIRKADDAVDTKQSIRTLHNTMSGAVKTTSPGTSTSPGSSTSSPALPAEVCDCIRNKTLRMKDAVKDFDFLLWLMNDVHAKASATFNDLQTQLPLEEESSTGEPMMMPWSFWSKLDRTIEAADLAMKSMSDNVESFCSMEEFLELFRRLGEVFNDVLQVRADLDSHLPLLVNNIMENMHFALERLETTDSMYKKTIDTLNAQCSN